MDDLNSPVKNGQKNWYKLRDHHKAASYLHDHIRGEQMDTKFEKMRRDAEAPCGTSEYTISQNEITLEMAEIRKVLEAIPEDFDDDILALKYQVEQNAVVEPATSIETREQILSSLFGQEN